MAASLGSLVVSLGLDAAEFTSGLSKAEREGKRAMQSLQRDFEMAATALVALGAAAVVMGAKFIDAAANLDDMAEKTGASVEELSKLEQQARISGTSLETMELGLVRLTKALHGGDEEAKGAGKALAALGLKADELRNKDTAQTLQLVADELNKYQDGAGKTALALDLFGKSGAQLLPILKDMANDARLNATLTAKQAAEAEELQKSFRRLGVEATNMGRALALEVVPPLQRIINELNEGTRAAGGFWRALLVGGSINPFNSLHENLVNYRKELRQLEAGGYGDTRMARLRRAQIEFLERQQRNEALGLEGGDTAGEMQRFGLRGAKLPLNYESATKAGASKKVVDDTVKERLAQITAEGRVLAEDRKAWEYLLREAAELKVGENIFGPESIAAGLSTQDIKKKLDATIQGAQALQDEWDRAGLAAAGFDENGKKIIADFVAQNEVASDEVHEFWRSAFESMQRSASDFIYDTMQGQFSDFGARFKQTMDRMVADWIAAQALMAATNYIKNNFLGGAGSGGILEGLIGTVGNWIGGTQAPAPVETRAIGGPVYPGQDYLVGERGPEIFRPRMAGAIIPNRDLPAQGDRAVYITVNSPDADSFRRTQRQLAAEVGAAFGAMG